MEDLKQHLAVAFRGAQSRKGLTQEALAEQIGGDDRDNQQLRAGGELGQFPVFLKLAAALDLSVTDVVPMPKHSQPRKLTARRRRLETDLGQLGECLGDNDLELLIGIGRLMSSTRRG